MRARILSSVGFGRQKLLDLNISWTSNVCSPCENTRLGRAAQSARSRRSCYCVLKGRVVVVGNCVYVRRRRFGFQQCDLGFTATAHFWLRSSQQTKIAHTCRHYFLYSEARHLKTHTANTGTSSNSESSLLLRVGGGGSGVSFNETGVGGTLC